MAGRPIDSVPADRVGGKQSTGPWPSDIEEIARDDRLQRPVTLSDDSRQEVEVTVTDVREIVRPNGEATGGHTISFKFEDPTLGGGA